LASTAKEKIVTFYKRNQSLQLKLKNYEIASLLGMSPETFSRNVKSLEKEQRLKKSKEGYVLVL
jgi:CRP-like cAMP-binding protein